MNKEGIQYLIEGITSDYCSKIVGRKWVTAELTRYILKHLDQENVRIVKEIELPENLYLEEHEKAIYQFALRDMLIRHNESLERLI